MSILNNSIHLSFSFFLKYLFDIESPLIRPFLIEFEFVYNVLIIVDYAICAIWVKHATVLSGRGPWWIWSWSNNAKRILEPVFEWPSIDSTSLLLEHWFSILARLVLTAVNLVYRSEELSTKCDIWAITISYEKYDWQFIFLLLSNISNKRFFDKIIAKKY